MIKSNHKNKKLHQRQLNTESRSQKEKSFRLTNTINLNKKTKIILLFIFLIAVIFIIGNYHIVLNATDSTKSLFFIERPYWGFSDIIGDINMCTEAPYYSVMSNHPSLCRALQKAEYLESEEARDKRIRQEVQQEFDNSFSEEFQKLDQNNNQQEENYEEEVSLEANNNQETQKTETPKENPTLTETKPDIASFGNGMQVIGIDIKAITYRSQGTQTCYWARLKGFSGQLDDILANGNNSPEIVAIASTDAAFQTSECGRWVAVESTYPATPATSFADGTYEVGKHIVSGTYRADGSPDSLCYWARLSNFSHLGISGIITNGNSPTVIQISVNDKGFTAFGCGTWTKIQ